MKENISLTSAEEKLANIIWQKAPLTSPDLVALAQKELDWKKSTTYTVLKKICNKGLFKNENTNLSVLISYDELISHQSRFFVQEAFGGSLPSFITAFFGGKKLTKEQADELLSLIEAQERNDLNG